MTVEICFICASKWVPKLSKMCLLLVRNLTTFQNKPPPFWICFWQRSSPDLCCRRAARRRCPRCLPRRPPWGPWLPPPDVHAWALGSAPLHFGPASTWGWATPWWPLLTGNKGPVQWELGQLRLLREISMAAPGPPTQAATLLYSSYTLMLWSSRIAAAAVVSSKAVTGKNCACAVSLAAR